jgi:hypothetical protein
MPTVLRLRACFATYYRLPKGFRYLRLGITAQDISPSPYFITLPLPAGPRPSRLFSLAAIAWMVMVRRGFGGALGRVDNRVYKVKSMGYEHLGFPKFSSMMNSAVGHELALIRAHIGSFLSLPSTTIP